MSKKRKPKQERKIIRKYSEEMKLAVVNSVEKEGMTVSEAAQHYKVPERNIYHWRGKYGSDERKAATEVIGLTVKSEADKIRKLEGIVSELSIECRVLREQTKIYEEMVGEEQKKKLSMKQLEELERLKKETQEMPG